MSFSCLLPIFVPNFIQKKAYDFFFILYPESTRDIHIFPRTEGPRRAVEIMFDMKISKT